MVTFIAALKEVTRSIIPVPAVNVPALKSWHLVVARSLLALVWGGIAWLITWLMVGSGLIGVVLATAGAVAMRWYLCNEREHQGMLECHECGRRIFNMRDELSLLAWQNCVMLVRPALLFLLIWRHQFLWIVVASALGMAIKLTVARRDDANQGWVSAVAIALLLAAIGSKLGVVGGNVFMLGVIASIISWLLSKYLENLGDISPDAALFIGETIALLIGIC